MGFRGSVAGGPMRFLLFLPPLTGALAVMRVFELENRTVFSVVAAALAGFVVHALLPLRFRLPFFAALSTVSVLFVLGIGPGAAVLSLGLVFIAACHLPIPFRYRLGLVVAMGGALFILRGSAGLPTLAPAVWPVLGSMLMFRMALYLHVLRHQESPPQWTWSVAYFFMLPNSCLPLFPVVDYQTFVRTYFDSEPFQIYERGVRFILRGVIHLLVYRLVYFHLALDERHVNDLGHLVQYVVSGFLLYVRVSGLFHLAVGILCLYGFRLPETHHLYFLSASLTDFWRRINIYWKDFMMKLVYYPSFFRLRRHGSRLAVVAATAVVFIATWLLHSYQFYWIRGTGLFAKRDMAFWAAFGGLVVLGALWEMRPGRRLAKTGRRWSAGRASSTVATFIVICVLWSVWNMRSKETWLFMWTQGQHSTPAQWFLLLGALAAAWGLAGFGWGAPTLAEPPDVPEPIRTMGLRMVRRTAGMGALALSASLPLWTGLPPAVGETVLRLRGQGDPLMMIVENEQLGYYEALTRDEPADAFRSWRPEMPPLPLISSTSYWVAREDFLLAELAPSKDSLWRGQRVTTNTWGMRDREYSRSKAPSTFRIAVVGPSDTFGWGVGDGEPFESVLEARLDSLARRVGRQVEVLNFGIPGHTLAQQVYQVERRVLDFDPDLIVLTVHPSDLIFLENMVKDLSKRRIAIPDSTLAALMASAGVGRDLGYGTPELRPIEEAIDERLFQWSRELGSRVGASVVILELRLVGQSEGNLATTRRAAYSTGLPVLDCGRVFQGRRLDQFREGTQDRHPNAAGHRLIADCTLEGLLDRAPAVRLDWIPLEAGRPRAAKFTNRRA